jgi:hypothetical protein
VLEAEADADEVTGQVIRNVLRLAHASLWVDPLEGNSDQLPVRATELRATEC